MFLGVPIFKRIGVNKRLSFIFRCVSAADDNLAIIWDIQLGYKLVVLSGHSRPITDMVVIPAKGEHPQQLLTGSSDKQIRVHSSY